MFANSIKTLVLCLVGLYAGSSWTAEVPRVLNIVNFVRGCEPRDPELDLVKPLQEEIWLNTHYGLKNTILMQYDAMLREDLMRVVKTADPGKTEYGLWIEIVKPLCEKSGIPWRGRKDWAWDWHVNPGFLMAYSPEDRERLCDECVRLFKERFGHSPESVGSWLLDAHSMAYLSEKHAIKAFCICREQDNTDAYGLRGGYFNGAYYPSRKNMLSAATDMANAVRTPVFRMLTPDPIYNYNRPDMIHQGFPHHGCPTLEPIGECGSSRQIVEWFFRTYAVPRAPLNLSYMQTGQENSFGWARIASGLPLQLEIIAWHADRGLIVETLAETGKRFAAAHAENCPQTQVALEDWSGYGRKSVWYNSRFYRANLFLDGDRLAIRDVHKMCDDFEEPFLRTTCESWKADYLTPPFVDAELGRGDGRPGDMRVVGRFRELEVEVEPENKLSVIARRQDGSTVRVLFAEGMISIFGADLEWQTSIGFLTGISRTSAGFDCMFKGFRYSVTCKAKVMKTDDGYSFHPENGKVAFDMRR